jgi:hypothetical protein
LVHPHLLLLLLLLLLAVLLLTAAWLAAQLVQSLQRRGVPLQTGAESAVAKPRQGQSVVRAQLMQQLLRLGAS